MLTAKLEASWRIKGFDWAEIELVNGDPPNPASSHESRQAPTSGSSTSQAVTSEEDCPG